MKTSILVKLGFSLVYASLTYSSPAPFYNNCNCTDWDVACWDACMSKDGDSHNQQFSLKKDDPCGLIEACIKRQHKHSICNGLPTYLPERCESPNCDLFNFCTERQQGNNISPICKNLPSNIAERCGSNTTPASTTTTTTTPMPTPNDPKNCPLIKFCIRKQQKSSLCNGISPVLPERCESPTTQPPSKY